MVVDILGISPCDNIYMVVSKVVADFLPRKMKK